MAPREVGGSDLGGSNLTPPPRFEIATLVIEQSSTDRNSIRFASALVRCSGFWMSTKCELDEHKRWNDQSAVSSGIKHMLRLRNLGILRNTRHPTAIRTMATANKVQLRTDEHPEYYREGITKEQTERASELLTRNHDRYHIFFQPGGLHNHIAHHLLAIWALNASTEQIQKNYDANEGYQRDQGAIKEDVLKELHDPKGFVANLTPRDNYHTFLQFFRDEIDKTTWQEVLQKYVFAGDERAEAMFVRMFAGFLYVQLKTSRRWIHC